MNELFEKNWLSAILLRDNSPSSTVFEILAFLCFAIFAKNSKIQNGRHFWRDKIFFKIGIATLQRYPGPGGQKFCRNRSI